jgi:hypothetical protein
VFSLALTEAEHAVVESAAKRRGVSLGHVVRGVLVAGLPGFAEVTRERVVGAPPGHGTESRYLRYRCRCSACRSAATEARSRRRAADPAGSRVYDRDYKRRRRQSERAEVAASTRSETSTRRLGREGS